MENLNSEQIIKALECCVNVGGYRDAQYCNECPLHEERCALLLPQNCLALITSQEQRIKELTEKFNAGNKEYIRLDNEYRSLNAKYIKLTEENERLRAMTHMLDEEYTETAKRFYKKGVTDMKERIEALFPSDKKYTTISIFTLVQSAKELKGGNRQ